MLHYPSNKTFFHSNLYFISGEKYSSQFLPCLPSAKACYGYNIHFYRISVLLPSSQTLFLKTCIHAYRVQGSLLFIYRSIRHSNKLAFDQQVYWQVIFTLPTHRIRSILFYLTAFTGLYAVLGIVFQIIRLAIGKVKTVPIFR